MRITIPGVIAALGLAALAQAQSGTKPIADSHCQILVPGDWTETKTGGIGARSPDDRSFNAVVRSFTGSEYQSVVDGVKQMKGAVVDENGQRILLIVPIFGGKKQYVAVTKTNPLACRTSVTFPEAKEPAARQIAESVKALK